MNQPRASRAPRLRLRWLAAAAAIGAAVVAALVPAALAGGPAPQTTNAYEQTNLVSDIPGVAHVTDPHLVNPWGVSAGPTTPIWVSDNGADVATLYSGGFDRMPVAITPLVVSIPGGAPTGQVFNSSSGFAIGPAGATAPARFIFASEAGTITAWRQNLTPATEALTEATTPGAIYKGLAIASTKAGTFLYAADFHGARIDVFDSVFKPAHLRGDFTDPALPAGYAPFNIQEIGGRLYVTYAAQDEAGEDDVPGAGKGFVDVFTTDGRLVRRLISNGHLNAPWGLVMAPAGFGAFGGDLLVGNFGDGTINAYDPSTGTFEGSLQYEDGSTIAIDGLWALRFGNGVAGDPGTLLFTAGIDDEAHGLFGSITPAD
jgi:uncharacterized protein (TIGR03118 family)